MRRTSSRDHTVRAQRRAASPGTHSTGTGSSGSTVEPRPAAFGLGTVQALDTGLSGPFIGELRHGASVEPGTPPSYGLDLEAVLVRGHQRAEPGRGPAVPAAQYAPRITVATRTAPLSDAAASPGGRGPVAGPWLAGDDRADRLGGKPCPPTKPPVRPLSPVEVSSL